MRGQSLEEFLAEDVSLQLANIRLSLNAICSGRSPLDPQTLHLGLKRIGAQLEGIERRARTHLQAFRPRQNIASFPNRPPRGLEDVLHSFEAEQENMLGLTSDWAGSE